MNDYDYEDPLTKKLFTSKNTSMNVPQGNAKERLNQTMENGTQDYRRKAEDKLRQKDGLETVIERKRADHRELSSDIARTRRAADKMEEEIQTNAQEIRDMAEKKLEALSDVRKLEQEVDQNSQNIIKTKEETAANLQAQRSLQHAIDTIDSLLKRGELESTQIQAQKANLEIQSSNLDEKSQKLGESIEEIKTEINEIKEESKNAVKEIEVTEEALVTEISNYHTEAKRHENLVARETELKEARTQISAELEKLDGYITNVEEELDRCVDIEEVKINGKITQPKVSKEEERRALRKKIKESKQRARELESRVLKTNDSLTEIKNQISNSEAAIENSGRKIQYLEFKKTNKEKEDVEHKSRLKEKRNELGIFKEKKAEVDTEKRFTKELERRLSTDYHQMQANLRIMQDQKRGEESQKQVLQDKGRDLAATERDIQTRLSESLNKKEDITNQLKVLENGLTTKEFNNHRLKSEVSKLDAQREMASRFMSTCHQEISGLSQEINNLSKWNGIIISPNNGNWKPSVNYA